MYAEDTIAAVATPPGAGAIGIVRASGPGAERIAVAVFDRSMAGPWETHRLYQGRLVGRGGALLDEALAVLMRAPRSYTGEDVLELYCHGSPLVLRLALESMLHSGARAARPGEFTKRAFLNGKLDLTQAEAVIDLVAARTPDGAGRAAGQLFGRLSRHLGEIRERLIRVKGLLEVRIDFVDDDLELDDAELLGEVRELHDETNALLQTYEQGRIIRDGLRVAITGRPNVGKSSLLNALLDEDRAIVTDTPGTTRDVIAEWADFGGIPVLLSDTAGLRESAQEVEQIGVERARFVVEHSDVVLNVLDASLPPESPAYGNGNKQNVVLVLNKVDLPVAWPSAEVDRLATHHPVVTVSATRGTGLDELRQAVVRLAGDSPSEGAPTLTTSRQRDSLLKVRDSLAHAIAALVESRPADLVAVDVQAALDHLGEVTGAVTSEDVLDTIFSQFCIGK